MNNINKIIESKEFVRLEEVEALIQEHFPTVKVVIDIKNVEFNFRDIKPSGLTAISMRNLNDGYAVFIDFNGWDSHLNHKIGYIYTVDKARALELLNFLTLSQLK